jgi:hypothetical protein
MSASRVLCGVFALAAVAAIAACGGSEPQPATTIGHALDYRRNASTGYLYVANESGYGPSGTGSILIFSESANGNVAPLDVISGSATGLSQINGIAVDTSGEIYVVDTDKEAILGFAAGASGDVNPNVTISGADTGLAWPIGLAVDDAGNLYVANCGSGCKSGLPAPGLLEFAAGSSGDATPVRNISGSNTQLTRSNGVAWRGDVYVSQSSSIVVFDQSANGNAKPERVISGSNTLLDDAWGVTADQHHVYAGSCADIYIERFSGDANGNVAPQDVISGTKTKLRSCIDGVSVAAHGRIFAATINAYPSIVGFYRLKSGNVRANTYIAGSNTGLSYPTFVFATPQYAPN